MLIPAAVLGCHGTLLICPLIIILPSHTPPAAAIEVKFPHQGFIPGLRNEKARGRLEDSGPCRPRSYGRFWRAVGRRVWAVSRIWHAEPPALPIIPNTRLVKYQLDLPSPLRTHRYQTKKESLLFLFFLSTSKPKTSPKSTPSPGKKKEKKKGYASPRFPEKKNKTKAVLRTDFLGRGMFASRRSRRLPLRSSTCSPSRL